MSFPEQAVMARLTDRLYQKAGDRKIPLSGTFELSPVCNFACKMCYVRKTIQEVKEHPRKMMSLEQWIELAEQARKRRYALSITDRWRTALMAGFLEVI